MENTQKPNLTYPTTASVDTVDNYFGVDVPDPYRWLEDDLSDETAAWVQSQNKVTFSYLDNISYREKIKSRLEKLYDYERVSAPNRQGDYDYFYKTRPAKTPGIVTQAIIGRIERIDDSSSSADDASERSPT